MADPEEPVFDLSEEPSAEPVFDLSTTQGVADYYQYHHAPAPAPVYP